MNKHFKYLIYILRHKFYTGIECFKFGLFWRGIIHDWSKFMPAEWFPYVEHFYGPKPIQCDETGYYHAVGIDDIFDRAWLHHIHYNAHHWQHWMLIQDDDEDKILEMPNDIAIEMICDWRGAGIAQGTPNTMAWYEKHKDKMKLHPKTRILAEDLLRSKSKGVIQ